MGCEVRALITQTDFINVKYIVLMIIILTLAVLTGCGAAGVNVSMDENELKTVDQPIDESELKTVDQPMDKNELKMVDQSMDESEQDSVGQDNNDDSEENVDTGIEKTQIDIYIEDKINSMTLEEKVAQIFIVFPESLEPGISNVVSVDPVMKEKLEQAPVGGIIYMNENIKNPEQVKQMVEETQQCSLDNIGLPLFQCVDEEGGRIARIANNKMFGVDNVGSMTDIGAKGDVDYAYVAGASMGAYLSELGFNLDFAPVADVQGDVYNSVLYRRTFSADPECVSGMANALAKGLQSKGVMSVYKHFPGHGSTNGDPHKGYAFTDKTLDDLKKSDLIPFEKGIEEDVPMIMVGHISLPNIIEDGTPASLSQVIITDLLRKEMEYDGVIITDAMNMGAIKDIYEADDAAVLAVKAGVDMVLMPKDFDKAYNGILKAVDDGELTESRIDESVRRILKIKLDLGY